MVQKTEKQSFSFENNMLYKCTNFCDWSDKNVKALVLAAGPVPDSPALEYKIGMLTNRDWRYQ